MGLETSTYIGGLTPSWPLAGDLKAQGDDHIRLIKATLQATFPTATKAFYFPKSEITSGAIVLDATDQNNTVFCNTSGGNIAVTLPTLAAADTGWRCEIAKNSPDTNAAIVSPASGSINTPVGAVATVRVGTVFEPAIFVWSGTAWVCYKPGVVIGTTYNFNGATIPPGFLLEDGSVYSNTAFAELFAVLGSTTLKDKRGRTEIGAGTGTGLTNRVLGTNYGEENHLLLLSEIPTGITSSGVNTINVNSTTPNTATGTIQSANVTGGADKVFTSNGANVVIASSGNNTINVTSNNTGGVAHNVIQPSATVQKIIRAC